MNIIATLGSEFVNLGLSNVCTLLSLLQLMLYLPVSGQMSGHTRCESPPGTQQSMFMRENTGDWTYGFFRLPFIGLYFQLKLIYEILQTSHILLVFFSLGCSTYPGLQFLELFLSTLHCQILSLIQTMLQIFDSHLQVLLHPLQLFLGLCSLAVSMTQLDLHLIQISFHLLFNSKGIISAPDLRVQSALHGIDHSLAVPLDLFHLLILLCKLPVDLTLHLRGTLGVYCLNRFLSLLQALGQLFPVEVVQTVFEHHMKWSALKTLIYLLGFFKFLCALDCISLIFSSPLCYFTIGLRHSPLEFSFGLLLFLKLLSEQITVMASRLNCMGQSILCLQGSAYRWLVESTTASMLLLLLDPLEIIDLLSELSHTVRLLLPEGCSSSFMLQGGLFQITTGGTSSFFKPLTDLFKFSGQISSLFLHFSTSSSLSFYFLLQFFYASLNEQRDESLSIMDSWASFRSPSSFLLALSSDPSSCCYRNQCLKSSGKGSTDACKQSHVINLLLQLGLGFGQSIDFVLLCLKIIKGLLMRLLEGFLFFGQLGNALVLRSHLLCQFSIDFLLILQSLCGLFEFGLKLDFAFNEPFTSLLRVREVFRFLFIDIAVIVLVGEKSHREGGCEEAAGRKKAKYQQLVQDCRNKGWTMWLRTVERFLVYICGDELLHIIDTLYSDFSLTDHRVVIRVGGDEQGLCEKRERGNTQPCGSLTQQLWLVARHELVEDVVTPLGRQLEWTGSAFFPPATAIVAKMALAEVNPHHCATLDWGRGPSRGMQWRSSLDITMASPHPKN
ncbi:hypothetical protein DNTS_006263 [Danionella cerebrum]|uniref:Uncharacterized protein n=1 Tax=Danionella cerebrum TaxID=2873325 RepID=A0A553QWM6_9TELE|nr:hypothetical protein DNTS_006263 [Danionella translucida]